MKKIFLLILTSVITNSLLAQAVSYYVVADQDDWQLYMSKQVATDLDAGKKVVFITLTAGDGGNGNGISGAAAGPYYLSREKGAIYSTKYVGDIYNPPIPPFNNTYPLPNLQTVTVNGKSLTKYYFGNPSGGGALVNYFLRLPDGGPTGAGYTGTGNKSLKKLKEGTIPNMTSVDGLNTYTWAQLTSTILAIIYAERGSQTQVWLNTSSLNTASYPDISDHVYSSQAAQDAVASQLAVGINEFVMDYSSSLPSNNSTTEEYQVATMLFGVYNWALLLDRYTSQLTPSIRSYFSREYFTQKRAPSGVLPVTLADFTGTLKSNNILLEWHTSIEINSKEFWLEKSYDGVTYHRIATIAAAGNSNTTKRYNYTDNEVTEYNYYRLNMVDLDGLSKRSNIVLVKNPGITQDVFVTTNPFSDHIGLRFTKVPKGQVSLRLVDLSGKQIAATSVYNNLSPLVRFDLNTAISRGIYVLQVESEGKHYSIKVLKQ